MVVTPTARVHCPGGQVSARPFVAVAPGNGSPSLALTCGDMRASAADQSGVVWFVERDRRDEPPPMNEERIRIRVTASGQTLEVVVLNKRLDRIDIVLGEGIHSVRCELVPTRNGSAYVGNAMGREIVYERSREEVKGDLARAAGFR
jgi:hypothetical protein